MIAELVGSDENKYWITLIIFVVNKLFGISLKDFLFLNSGVSSNCTDLWKDYNYCVAAVGDISRYPGYRDGIPRYTPTASLTDLAPATNTISVTISLPSPTHTIMPLAPGSRTDCKLYYENTVASQNCAVLVYGYGLSFEQFIQWNPCKCFV